MDGVRLLTLIIALVFTAMGVSVPLITLYLEALGADYVRISLILTTFAATAMVGNYVWGRVSDRLGRRKPLIMGGLAGLALAYALLSRAPTANWAWSVRVLEGASAAAYTTTSLALMGDLLAAGGGHRGRRMGTYRGMGSLAFAVGALAGGRLADHYSLRLAFGLCAILYTLAALGALALREVASPTPPAEAPSTEAGVWPLASPSDDQRLPLPFLAGVFLWMAALASSASMWPNFMARLGYGKTVISGLWGLAAVTEAPVMWLAGNLSDVVGRAPLLTAGGIGVALVMLGYLTVARVLSALAGVQIVRGLAYGTYTASAMIFATEVGDERVRGSNSGLYNAAASGGQLMGLLMGGTLAQVRGFAFLFWVCAAGALLSGACFWTLRRRQSGPLPSR